MTVEAQVAKGTVGIAYAARRLGVSENFLRSLIARGESPVPWVPVGRLKRIPIEPLERLLAGIDQGGEN